MVPGTTERTRQFSKTKLCKFELLGMCSKGTSCPFAHGETELRDLPDLRCTKLCFSVLQTGSCNKPDCTFAHSKEELRTTGTLRKTKLCRFAKTGKCALGPKCSFAHSPTEIRQKDLVTVPAYAAFPPGLGWQDPSKTWEAYGEESTSSDLPECVEEAVEQVLMEDGADALPYSGYTSDTAEGISLGMFGMAHGMGEMDWMGGAYGSSSAWAGSGGLPFADQGPPGAAAFGVPAYDEPAYVPLPTVGMGIEGSVAVSQQSGVWQAKAATREDQAPPTPLRSVRTSESTLCTLGDERTPVA